MPVKLYSDAHHQCLMFTDLVDGDPGGGVQASQFLITDSGTGCVIDPGGNIAFNEMYLTMSQFFSPHALSYIVVSHVDPDTIASCDRWMTSTPHSKVIVSSLWTRFVPHFTKPGKTRGRIVGVPDEGGRLQLGQSELWLIPAHFLHAEGNFHFYDPVSKILFSGDLGVSLMSGAEATHPITDFKAHLPKMEGFHRRYMSCNKAMRLWVNMARQLPEITMIVPQHGAPIKGKQAITDFFDWAENLECGIDLFDQNNYRLPAAQLDLTANTL